MKKKSVEFICFNSTDAKGKNLLFIHGAWHGAWCWEPHFLPFFSENGFNSYAFSFRGHGNSWKPRSFFRTRLDHYLEDLASVVNRFPSPPILIGHSMGGFIVHKFIEKVPVPAAVLLAPVPVEKAFKALLRIAKINPAGLAQSPFLLSLAPLVQNDRMKFKLFFNPEDEMERYENFFPMIKDESFFVLFDMLFSSGKKKFHQPPPTLVVGGKNDTIIRSDDLTASSSRLGAEQVVLPEMGHDVMLDQNWKKAATVILNWLKNLP